MSSSKIKNDESEQLTGQRLDSWLFAARLFKTRSQASKACDGRKVKVNGKTGKPAKTVRVDDRLTIRNKAGKYFTLDILELCEKNLSKQQAKRLYHLHQLEYCEETQELLELFNKSIKAAKPKYKGRPTKKERRKLAKIQRSLKESF
jgi:ribosome-associated heat shock protein Hsp15